METLPITAERKAQLEEYAKRHKQTPAQALDDLLRAHLAWEDEEHEDTVQALQEADADIAAGRTKPAEKVYASLRLKHGLQD